MTSAVLPVAKCLYVCDEVLKDPASGKVSLLNLWDTVRVPPEREFPFSLQKLCVFAWLRDGQGQLTSHLDVVRSSTGDVIRRTKNFVLNFESRTKSVFAWYKIEDCVFPAPGYYLIEWYCEDQFVEDQVIQVVPGK